MTMKKILFRIGAIVMAACLLFLNCGSTPICEPIRFENGLSVALLATDSPIESAVFYMGFGEVDGPPFLATITNRLLLRGTEIRNGRQIFEEIESLGGELGTSTGLTSSLVYVQSPAGNFEDCFRVLCECLTQATFDSMELSRLNRTEYDFFIKQKNILLKKQVWTDHSIRTQLFPNSSMGRDLSQKLRSYSRDEIVSFYRNHFQPTRMVLSISGPIPRKKIIRLIKTCYNQFNRLPNIQSTSESSSASERLRQPIPYSIGKEDTVFFAYKGAAPFTESFLLGYLAETALSDERTGYLVELLKAKGITNFKIQSYCQYENIYSYFVTAVAVPRGTGDRTMKILEAEIQNIRRNGVSDEFFQTAKRQTESILAIQYQYTLSNAVMAALTASIKGPCLTIPIMRNKIHRLTLNEFNGSLDAVLIDSIVRLKKAR